MFLENAKSIAKPYLILDLIYVLFKCKNIATVLLSYTQYVLYFIAIINKIFVSTNGVTWQKQKIIYLYE